MLELLGDRQKALLGFLLRAKDGMTIYELSDGLGITRNAVRQHLAALENEGLVTPGPTRASGGRPEQLYLLADKGRELFPRQYSWLARLMLGALKEEAGQEGGRQRLAQLGASVGAQLASQHASLASEAEKIGKISVLMQELGYNSHLENVDGRKIPLLEADNCVFHEIAMQDPDICQFDLALLSSFTGSKVDHLECMAKGGGVCRFRFVAEKKTQRT